MTSPRPLLRVVHLPGGAVLAGRAGLANTFWTRLRGLLGTSGIAEGEGLVIDPCNSVHTFWMGYPIDVVFTDGEGEVVEVVEDLRPWRATRMVRNARLAVELPSGTASGVRRGDRLRFDPAT